MCCLSLVLDISNNWLYFIMIISDRRKACRVKYSV